MAADNLSSSKSSSSTADSYIGSLISLTSKSEIRYEGVLYNINTEESSIGLINVRSFGTEGRKKDGHHVFPSDKVYEYILFRGSDIKDLQVINSLPVQPTQPINNDPAIIQSHYPHPVSTTTSLPSAVSGSLTDLSSHSTQLGLPGSSFQGGMPLYQPGGNLGSWGASPPPPAANGSGLAMPMYWQGYYGPPNGLSHLHQQSLLQPPHGMSMAPSMQYPNFNASLQTGASNMPGSSNFPGSNMPEVPSPLFPMSTSSLNLMPTSLSTSTLPSSLPPVPSAMLAPEVTPSSVPNKVHSSTLPTATLGASMPSLSPLTTSGLELNTVVPPASNKPNAISAPLLPYESSSQSMPSIVGPTSSVRSEARAPSLVTPGQLMQSGPTTVPLSQSAESAHKDVEVVRVSSSSSSSEPSAPVATEAQPPILPLPVPSRGVQKPNGAPYQTRHGYSGYRGRERGRGSGSSRPVARFTEDFDFMAMNEKFKKDEVWGHLGKSNKKDKEVDGNISDEDDFQDEDEETIQKPVYNKDDFFDSLSSNALDYESQNGRTRFSEQMKIDTETFGEFSRYRGGRGPGRGGGRFRGSYYGRGYGYGGRGRGRGMPTNRAS